MDRLGRHSNYHYRSRCLLLAALIFIVVTALFSAGCRYRSRASAPVSNNSTWSKPRPPYHQVLKGETLYSIAWQYGLDYRKLAQINNIRAPYTIYPGQKLKTGELLNNNKINNKQMFASQKRHKKTRNFNTQEKYVKNVEQVTLLNHWLWPTRGRVVRQYDAKDPTRDGIDIAGHELQPIIAAASGKVVYSGNGLVGYGNLVIIKHNDQYLTAYGYLAKVLIKEGDELKAGKIIGKMGRGSGNKAMLHFQIRKNGKPVNPLKYLSRAN